MSVLEDVLYAFAVEPDRGKATLERYLSSYPEFAAELIDLSYELSKDFENGDSQAPISPQNIGLIDRLWLKHVHAIDSGIH